MGRRRTPTFQALDDVLVSSGLQPDRHTMKRLLWEAAANVTFWNGTVRRKIPAAFAFQNNEVPLDRVNGLAQQFLSTGTRYVWASAQNMVIRWFAGAPSPILGLGSYVPDATATQRPSMVDFTPYGDWMVMNPSTLGQQAWLWKEGIGSAQPAQWPTGVTKYLKVLSFLMALGYGPRGTQVGWSDSEDIEIFTGAPDNLAGSLSLDEFNTPIRAGAKLGDAVAAYSEDQMALIRYIGLPFNFGQRTTIDGIGCVGKYAVASDLRQNVGMGRAGAWWTDGASFRYIDEGYIANYFQDNINWDQAAKIVVGRNDFTGCFEFHYPKVGSQDVNEAFSWDPRTGGWSPCPAYSMMDERRLFNHVLYGDNLNNVLFGDFNPDAAADLILETKPLVMQSVESPHVVTRVDEVDLLLHQAANLEWRLGSCDEPNGDWEWTEWMEALAGARVYEVPDGLPENPFWKLGLRNKPAPASPNWDIDLQGFLLYGVPVGGKM